jgi:outer membrane lipoprotein SlyB
MQFGSMQQDTATRQAQAAYQEFLRQQQLPYQALQAYNQTLQTSPYEKTTSTSGVEMSPMTQQSSNPLMGAIGGALSGAKLGGTLLPGGWGAGLGAIGGGLLGAFS